MGAKSDDRTCVPLCRECHDLYHQKGQAALEERHNVNLWREQSRTFRKFIDQQGGLDSGEPK